MPHEEQGGTLYLRMKGAIWVFDFGNISQMRRLNNIFSANSTENNLLCGE